MKKLTTYNRAAGYLNHIFDLLNAEYFENQLARPTITIQSTPKAYGHFVLRDDTWIATTGASVEINIGAGTLASPVEFLVSVLLHECIHYWLYAQGIQSCSRGGLYHNRRFRDACLERDLIVTRSDKYGWSHTSPGDGLLEFVLRNDLTDILLYRNEMSSIPINGGTGTHDGIDGSVVTRKSNSRKYVCPHCGMSVRATRAVHIACIDCGNVEMQLETR